MSRLCLPVEAMFPNKILQLKEAGNLKEFHKYLSTILKKFKNLSDKSKQFKITFIFLT